MRGRFIRRYSRKRDADDDVAEAIEKNLLYAKSVGQPERKNLKVLAQHISPSSVWYKDILHPDSPIQQWIVSFAEMPHSPIAEVMPQFSLDLESMFNYMSDVVGLEQLFCKHGFSVHLMSYDLHHDTKAPYVSHAFACHKEYGVILIADGSVFGYFESYEQADKLIGLFPKRKRTRVSYINFVSITKAGFKKKRMAFSPMVIQPKEYFGEEFEQYDARLNEIITDLGSGLVMLHGDPGTGKTTYIHHLLSKHNRTRPFWFGSYDLINQLSTFSAPDLLKVLGDGSVLILEDAEALISLERNAATSVLLSLADGFLGKLSNLLIIVTFNIEYGKIDPALTRPGRLLFRYEFGKTSPALANALRKKYKIPGDELDAPATIAEVFSAEQVNVQRKKKGVGFNGQTTNT